MLCSHNSTVRVLLLIIAHVFFCRHVKEGCAPHPSPTTMNFCPTPTVYDDLLTGLTIALRQGEERQAVCRLGSYYAKLPDGGRSLFAPDEGESRRGRVVTQLESLRVWFCVFWCFSVLVLLLLLHTTLFVPSCCYFLSFTVVIVRPVFLWQADPQCSQVYVAEGGGEEWQLDGIVWKSSRREE